MNRTYMLLSALALLSISFIAASIVLPWWTLQISPEASIIFNSGFRNDFNLFKTVSSSYTDNSLEENATTSIEVNLSNLTSPQQPNPPSFAFMDTTLQLTGAGLALTIPIAIGAAVTRARKYLRYILTLGYIAAVILVISAFYFSQELPTQVSGLSSISPIVLPSGWTPIYPGDIASAWGGKADSSGQVSTWLKSNNFWTWGPSSGWFLALSAALLNVVACVAIQMIMKREQAPPKGSMAAGPDRTGALNPETS